MNPAPQPDQLSREDIAELIEALNRICDQIENIKNALITNEQIEHRVDTLEQEESAAKVIRLRNSVWIDRALLVLTGAVITAILKHVGAL